MGYHTSHKYMSSTGHRLSGRSGKSLPHLVPHSRIRCIYLFALHFIKLCSLVRATYFHCARRLKYLATAKEFLPRYIEKGLHSVLLQHITLVIGGVATKFSQRFLGCCPEYLKGKITCAFSIKSRRN